MTIVEASLVVTQIIGIMFISNFLFEKVRDFVLYDILKREKPLDLSAILIIKNELEFQKNILNDNLKQLNEKLTLELSNEKENVKNLRKEQEELIQKIFGKVFLKKE